MKPSPLTAAAVALECNVVFITTFGLTGAFGCFELEIALDTFDSSEIPK